MIPRRFQLFSGKKSQSSMSARQREGVYGYVLSLLWLMSRIAAFCLSLDEWICFFRPSCQKKSALFGDSVYPRIFWGRKGESEFVFTISKVRPTKVKKAYTSIFSPNKINPSSKIKRAIPLGNLIFSLSHFCLTAHLAANMRLLTNEGPETGFSR